MRISGSNFSPMAALAAAVFLAGCEADDPKIRQEVAELRAKVAELEKKNASAGRSTSGGAVATSAASSDTLSRETLRRNLEARMPALRAALTKAFPDYRVDPVNAATISTPQDSNHLPYSTEVSFGLSQGETVASFSIRIGADRSGNWQLPEFEDLAASVGNLASSGAVSPNEGEASSGRGARMDQNVRQIQWNDGPTGGQPAAPPDPQPASVAPAQQRQPAANAPFPVQDSRTIEFD